MKRKHDELAVEIDSYHGRLYSRSGTENLWLRVKLPEGGYFRQSTNRSDIKQARARALEIMLELKVKAQHNLSPRTKKFGKVAQRTLDDLKQQEAQPRTAATAKSYACAIERYLIPFFGAYNIDNIDRPLLAHFDAWRSKKLGRTPKRSTIQNHNAALNCIFDTAMDQGWLKSWQRPSLENKGDEGDTRATFTQEEFEHLSQFIDKWVFDGRDGYSRQIRFALRDLVLTVAATGMRPGTETRGLTWNDVEENYKHADGETYLRFWLTEGKTDKREIIVPSGVRLSLDRLKSFNPNIKPMSPVFAAWDGRYPEFCHPFRRLLEAAEIVRDRHGDERTLYSLRHFYATRQRERGVSFEILSKQMGTSIAMLEKHYVHVTPTVDARLLAGLPDPQIALVHDFILSQQEQRARQELRLDTKPGRALVIDSSGAIKAA